MIVPVITFIVCFSVIYVTYWAFVVRPEEAAAGTVRKRLKKTHVRTVRNLELLKQTRSLSAIGPMDALLKRAKSRSERIQLLLDQAGLNVSVGTVVTGSAVLAALGFFVLQQLTGWMILAVAAAVMGALIPINVVKFIRTRRMRKFEEQFPEALDLLGRALRAGHAFTTGVEMVAKEMPDPIGPEFQILYDQQNYGMPLPDALRQFAERVPVLDARFFVTAVLIQRETGGNLSEVLDNLAAVMRERFRVKRQIRVISAHGRLTGWILVCLPPVLGFVLFLINQETRELMFYDPLGQRMIVVGIVLQVIGTLIMRKIIDVEY